MLEKELDHYYHYRTKLPGEYRVAIAIQTLRTLVFFTFLHRPSQFKSTEKMSPVGGLA